MAEITLKPFDDNRIFVSDAVSDQGAIRRQTVRGAGVTMIASVAGLLIQLLSTMLLARILMPRDFGLVTMVTTFSLLVVNFGFNGFTEAIVQREEIDRSLASNLFWINLGCGVLLTIGFASAGSLLAWFYHDPLVRQVAEGISFTIVVTSLSTIHLALLKRAMRFSWVSVNDICARAVSVGLSIALAWRGFGYWALVAGVVAVPVSTCIGAWILCSWLPDRPRRNPETGPTLRFALNTYATFAVNYGSRNTDNLLVGWRFDAQSLGFYKKAYDLFALAASQLVTSIAVVVIAGFSRTKKDVEAYRNAVLEALSVMAFVGMWVGAVLTVIGKDLILVVLGPKWGPAGAIFTYFGPGIGVMILYHTLGWIHLSLGRPDRYLRWEILEFVITCSLFVLGLRWGPSGVAMAWSTSFLILTVPGIWYAGRPVRLSVLSVLSIGWRYLLASLTAVAGVLLILHGLPALRSMTGVFAAASRAGILTILTSIFYLGLVVALHAELKPVLQTVEILRGVVQPSRRRAEERAQAEGTSVVPASAQTPAAAFASTSQDDVPLVSILIPAYNAEQWIGDTLNSALAQTWPRTEIIVVDDGSKDHTLEIARRFESQGVRVIAQRNQGASAARNHAFSISHGDYIQWLDADDLLAPDKIARQMEVAMQGLSKETLLSCPWGRFRYRHDRAQFEPTALWCNLTPQEWLVRKMALNIYMQTSTWLVSREVTEAAGPWDIRLLGDDDGEYFCRVLLASDGVRFVPAAKVYYRAFRFDTLSFIGRFPKKIEAHWISMQLHVQYLRSLRDNSTTRAACLQYLRDALIYFYPERTHILREASELAAELGGELGKPKLSWKYAWLELTLGWGAVKPFQNAARMVRSKLASGLDYVLFNLENRNRARAGDFPSPRVVGNEIESQAR